MYFSIKPINNSTYYNRETLSLVKNLQSLGFQATGNLSYDRQNLQIAEYEKRKQTLSPSHEQIIQNAPVQFNSILENNKNQQFETNNVANTAQITVNNNDISLALQEKTGATQLAELNKIIHNIAA